MNSFKTGFSRFPAPAPVCLRGEDSQHGRPVVDLQHVGQRLQDVEVEEGVAGHGAVEAGLEEGRPVALQHPWRAAVVILADSGNSGEDHLWRSSRGRGLFVASC